MSGLHPGADTEALIREARTAFLADAPLRDAVCGLAGWFSLLRTAPFETLYRDERVEAAFASETGNPAAWCLSSGFDLAPELVAPLRLAAAAGGQVYELPSVSRYLLGRASMRCMMSTPA